MGGYVQLAFEAVSILVLIARFAPVHILKRTTFGGVNASKIVTAKSVLLPLLVYFDTRIVWLVSSILPIGMDIWARTLLLMTSVCHFFINK